MGKLLVDVDREALERVRVKLGARSLAEALRKLIAEADDEPIGIGRQQMQARTAEDLGGFDPPDTSGAKVKGPGRPKAPYGSRLKKR